MKKLDSFKKISEYLIKNSLKVKDIKSDIENYEKKFFKKYSSYLFESKYIWSDNLTFPLKYNKQTIITGSFLWKDVTDNKEYKKDEINTIRTTKPDMIGLKNFSSKSLRKSTNFTGVNIYNYSMPSFNVTKKNALLISTGKSKFSNKLQNEIIKNKKMINKLSEFFKIYIEPAVYKNFADNPNIVKADFSKKMYNEILIGIIRPGIGTICDLLTSGCIIFALNDKHNKEMVFNSKRISKMNIGKYFFSIKKALLFLNKIKKNKLFFEKKIKHLKNIKFGGIDETAELLIKHFNF